MNEFFTWQTLATIGGAAAATSLITQFIKGVFSKLPTQILSYAVALLILIAATAALGTADGWSGYAILPVNAAVVSLAGNGAYSGIQRILDGVKQGD